MAYEEVLRKWEFTFSDNELDYIKKFAPKIFQRYAEGPQRLLPIKYGCQFFRDLISAVIGDENTLKSLADQEI